ncbi:MAG: immunoglobulin domain-containing protein [Verrucomicrobiota bacterium]
MTNPDGVRSSQPALLRVIARPVITEEPADQALVTGEQLVLKVSVSTEVPCTYQWYLNGVALPGSNKPVLTFYNIQANHSGAYQLAINNFTGVVRSRIVAVTVTDAAAAKAANSVNLQSNLDGLTLGGERDAGGRWVLTVRGQPGQSYDLEGTSDLRTWESLGTVSSESGVSRLVDPASTGQPLRLYRVRTRQAALR